MKSFFLGTLVALGLLSLFAWCITPQRDVSGKTSIIWSSDDNPARRDQIGLFNELHPTIDLRLDPSIESLEKVIVQSLAGVGPDLFCAYNAFFLNSYVRSGIALDITDRVKKAGIDIERDLWRAGDSTYIYEGRIYGLPANVATDAIWFNKNIFDAMNVPYPRGLITWDEFITLAQKLTLRDENGRIKHFGFLYGRDNFLHFLVQFGGRLYSEDGTTCVIDSPQCIEAVQFMYDLIYKHKISPSPRDEAAMATQGGWGSGLITWFGGERGAMALGGRWWLCILRSYSNLRLGAIPSPYAKYHVYKGYGKSVIINRFSPHIDEAFEFLKYMTEKPYNDLINHQADALAPVKKYCYTDEYLHDTDYPEEDFNDVWRDVMEYSIPEEVSPFVNGAVTMRIIDKQLELIMSDQKNVADGMKTAARLINEEIRKNCELDPSMKRKFEARRNSISSETK